MVSGYLNTFRDSVGSLAHCVDNYVPGILNWAEMHDVAGLIAPRPLFVESGEQDNIFPIAASIASFRDVRGIYRSSRPRTASSRKCFQMSTHSGESAASRSWRGIFRAERAYPDHEGTKAHEAHEEEMFCTTEFLLRESVVFFASWWSG